MPLGDSLTSGISGFTVPGAYRNRLYSVLTTAGYNVDFIGTNTDAGNPSLPDINHQGTGGYRIDNIQSGIAGWLNSVEDPDVVLLMIGTNDFSQNFNLGSVQTRLTNLIADIAVKRPFAKIIVASLPLRSDSALLQSQQSAYSAAIPGIVSNQVTLGRQVSFVDMSSVLVAGDLTDGVHPNQAGYNKVGDAWLPAIMNVIAPLGTSNPPAIVRAGPPTDPQHLTVKFSKPLADSAANPANFSINGGLSITQAVLDAATKRTITLTTSSQTPGTLYTMSVSGVKDRTASQNPIAPGSTVAFSTDAQTNGSFESDFANWTKTGNVEIKNASPYAPTNGSKLAAFNSQQTTPNGVLSQTFSTTIGVQYVLAFDAGALGTASEQRLNVSVTGSGNLLSQVVSIVAPGGSGSRWVPQAFGFVANSTTTTMTFSDQSPVTDSVDLLLDNVRLTTQVPRTLTVASSPINGISVSLSPADLNGASGAPTGFSRQYTNNTTVTLTAPATAGANAFVKWQRNGTDFTTNTTTTITLDADYTMNAVYSANNQVIVNGSFESDYTGWTKTGNQEIRGGAPYVATVGTKMAAFNTGQSTPNGTLSQSFATTSGASYTLTFDAGAFAYNTSPQSIRVTVTGSGTILNQTVTVNGIGGGATRWVPQSFSFVANSANTTLAFQDVSPTSNSIDLVLDNVKVLAPIGPINNSPVAVADTYNTSLNVPLIVPAAGVLANDTDSESNPLTAVLNVGPGHGNVVLNANGSFTYTPTTGYSGPDSFTYHANDGFSDSNIATVSITVSGVASGTLTNGSFEDGENGWTMTGNRVVFTSDGTYVAFDGTKMAIFNAANTNPDGIISQTVATTIGQSYQLALRVGIVAVNGSQQRLNVAVTGAAVTPLVSQTETLNGNSLNNTVWSSKTYNFTADSTSTTVTFSDISPSTNGADLLIDFVSLMPVQTNSAPVAVADSYSTPVDTALVVAAAGVLANDTDAQTDPLTAIVNTPPTNGTLTLNPNGGFTYTPAALYIGPDSFTYHANDGNLDSNVVTVSITVGGTAQLLVNGSFESGETGWTMAGNRLVFLGDSSYIAVDGDYMLTFNAANKTPDAVVSQAFTTVPGQTYTLEYNVGILALNTAQQKLQVDITGATAPFSQLETLTGNGLGNTVWSPKNYTFVAAGTSATLTFSDLSTTTSGVDLLLDLVKVTGASSGPVNTPPTAVAESYSTNQNVALVVPAAGVLTNDTDTELNPLTAVLNTSVTHGTLALNANGGFTYTPTSGYSGPDSFTYHANDGTLDSNIVTVSLTVNAVASGALVNGSFEADFTGWTTTGNQFIQSSSPYTATDGSKLVSFNAGNQAPNGTVSQSFGTVSGQTYTLAFDAGVFSFNTNPQKLLVTVNGTASLLSQSITINGLGGGSNRWVPQSFTFVADSASATLTFTDQSASTNGLDLLLDNVRVTGPPVGNVAPLAVADSYTTNVDTQLVIAAAGVLSNDTDVNSDPLTAVLGTGPTNGVLTLNPNGGFTYTPNSAYTGPDSFTYRANDGALNSNLVTVSISVSTPTSQLLVNGSFESDYSGWTIAGNQFIQSSAPYVATDGSKLNSFNAGNQAPNGVISQSFSTTSGKTYTLTFDAGVFSFNTNPQKLQVTVNGTGSLFSQVLTLTGLGGGTNRWLPQSFTFVADSAVSTLTFRDQSASTNGLDLLLDNVSVTGPPGIPNTAPVATGESYSTNQATALVVAAPGLLANDTDTESNPLTAVVDTQPTHGTLTLATNGGFTYTPTANYSGPDSFTYHANDGVVNSNIVTVDITVNPVSQGGLANGSFEQGETGWIMTGNRIVFDTDASYIAYDGSKLLVFNAANNTPDAVVKQSFATTPGQAYKLAFRMGILAGNGAEQRLKIALDGTSQLLSQTESLFGNSQANTVWTAKSYNFTADSTVTMLTFTDMSILTGGVDLLLDNVTVTPVAPNAAPVANADSYSTNQDTPLVVAAAGVLTNDTDAETDPLTAVLNTAPGHGTFSLSQDGSFTYTPDPHYFGPDTFTYHANDGTSNSNVVTVTINVARFDILVNGSFESGETGWTMTGNRVVFDSDGSYVAVDGTKMVVFNAANSTPDAVISQTFTTIPGEDYLLEFSVGTFAGNGIEQKLQVDVTGSTTLVSATESVFGSNSPTTVWTAKSYAFTADSASTTLTFTDISPGSSLVDMVLDNVRVSGPSVGMANTPPVAVADSYTTTVGVPLVVSAPGVLSNDTDVELSPLVAVLNAGPANGTVTLNSDGSFTYTPTAAYSGPDSFTYHANDGSLDSNVITVSITVNAGFAGLVNGSFESNFTGWTKTGNIDIQSSSPYVPTNGSKLAAFNSGNTTPNGVLSQTFATTPGSTYTLLFDAGTLSYNTNTQRLQVGVTGTGSLLSQSITLSSIPGSTKWTAQSFTFVANSASTTLAFADTSTTGSGLDLVLDNVRVNGPPGGGVNTAPVAVDDSYSAVQDNALVVAAPGVLSNDTDAQSNPLTTIVGTLPSHGNLTLNANGSFTYTPAPGYTGPDSFTYRANDGSLNSSVATVTLTVGAGGVNGFTNGSFESDFAGWTKTGNIEIQSTAPYQPTEGVKLASFNSGNTTPNGVLSQTFATTPGATYTLAFDAGTLAFNTSQQKLLVTVAGAANILSQNLTLSSTSGTTKWTAQSFTFVATGASTTLAFTDTSTTGAGLDLVIDNVRVTLNVAAPLLQPLTVNSTPVTANITVTPNDSGGNGNGTTNFGRTYANGTAVTLTAPATSGGVAFVKWQKNGSDVTTNLSTNVTMDAAYTMTAVYSNLPFSNGSFETGAFAPWTISGGTVDSVKIDTTTGGTNGTKITAFNSFESPSGGMLTQTFLTTPGVTYNLNFDLGVVAYNFSQQSLLVNVTGNSNLLTQTATINGIGGGTVKWEAKSFTFTADSTATTLKFTDTSVAISSIDMFLDNVRVTNVNARTLTVDSAGASSVAVTVSPTDNNGAGNGTTQFIRSYNLGTTISLTAPATAPNGATFVKWVKDGVDHATTQATTYTVTADASLFAIYSGGTYAPLGSNIIQNGSFEIITGHGETATANSWVEANDSTRIEQPGPGYPEYTTDGYNMLSFSVGGTPSDGQIAQAFPTVIGTTYTLRFDCGANGTPVINQLLDVNVFGAGGAPVLTRRLTLPGGNAVVKWLPQVLTFTANSTSSTLMFSDGSTTGNLIDIFVDNVRVQAGTLPPAVLTVNTTPVTGKAITVGTPDVAGQGNGTSNVTRIYNPGATVSLVAPHVGFVKWLKDGQWYSTNNSITVSMETSHVMTVVYTDTPVLGPFTNGSFENEFAGWTWTGGPQTVKVKDGLPTTDGLIVVEFNSADSGLDGAISQTFTTTPGTLYNVTFDVGSKAFNNATQTIKVKIDGSSTLVNQNFTITGAGNGDVTYVSRAVSFTANSATTTLVFSDQSSTGVGIDLLLDNVKVIPAPANSLAPGAESGLSITEGNTGGSLGTANLTITPGNSAISMNTVEPGTYFLESSEDLQHWNVIETKVQTEPGLLEFNHNPNALAPEQPKARMFYRIGHLLPD